MLIEDYDGQELKVPEATVQQPEVGTTAPPDPVGGLGAKVGFFPTINGPFHIGHGWCWAIAGLLAKKIGAKLQLNCTIGKEMPTEFVARQIGILSSLVLPHEVICESANEKCRKLLSGELLADEARIVRAALNSGRYETKIEDDETASPWYKASAMFFREKGTPIWYRVLQCHHWMKPEEYVLDGLAFEYFIQGLYGVTISVDGMFIATTMLPHWKALAALLGKKGFYWQPLFVPNICEAITHNQIAGCNAGPDLTRGDHWRLERWLNDYGRIPLLRLYWSWMQEAHENIPTDFPTMARELDLKKMPWVGEEVGEETTLPPGIEINSGRVLYADFFGTAH